MKGIKKSVLWVLVAAMLVTMMFNLFGCEENSTSSTYTNSDKKNNSYQNIGTVANNYGAATPSATKKSYSKTSCGHASCAENGPFYCMGKNNTCPNKTYCAYDLYCNSCD